MRQPPCKEGDLIELLMMPNDPDPIIPGEKGLVVCEPVEFQGSWHICVKWDNGRSLNMCSPPDRFRILKKEEHDQVAEEKVQ